MRRGPAPLASNRVAAVCRRRWGCDRCMPGRFLSRPLIQTLPESRATSRYASAVDTAARPSLRPEGAMDRIERMTSSEEYEPSALGSMLRIKL